MNINDMIIASNQLGEDAQQFLIAVDAEYAKPLVVDGEVSPAAGQRGYNIGKLLNALDMALFTWRLATKQWRSSENVKQIVQEYNQHHPESPITFDGDRRCPICESKIKKRSD